MNVPKIAMIAMVLVIAACIPLASAWTVDDGYQNKYVPVDIVKDWKASPDQQEGIIHITLRDSINTLNPYVYITTDADLDQANRSVLVDPVPADGQVEDRLSPGDYNVTLPDGNRGMTESCHLHVVVGQDARCWMMGHAVAANSVGIIHPLRVSSTLTGQRDVTDHGLPNLVATQGTDGHPDIAVEQGIRINGVQTTIYNPNSFAASGDIQTTISYTTDSNSGLIHATDLSTHSTALPIYVITESGKSTVTTNNAIGTSINAVTVNDPFDHDVVVVQPSVSSSITTEIPYGYILIP